MSTISDELPTAFEQRDALRSGQISSRELTEEALQQANTHQNLGAFVSVEAELALAEASAADRRITDTPAADRQHLPALLGLPTAHKDLVNVRGFVTTSGSAAVPHPRAERDDPIAAVVRAAGAICIGKTQVPEFGIAGYSENLVAAAARNPFDETRTAGGSSGGTATAIAAGIVSAAIGSDAGGSIRIPSAACGLVGLKPGRGRVPADSAQGEIDDLGVPRMAVSGPMARTALDAALWFDAICAPDAQTSSVDTTGTAVEAVRRAGELRGLRIGVSLASPFESRMPILFDDDAKNALHAAINTLEAAGHRVEEAAIDYGSEYPEAFTTVWTQALTRIPFTSDEDEAKLGDLAKWFLDRARSASHEKITGSIEALARFSASTAAQWANYDAVLTPALAHTAPKVGEFWALGAEADYRLQCEWAPQTSMANVVGVPAVAVPISTDRAGLPRGVQLIGRMGSEVQLLQLAEQLLRG